MRIHQFANIDPLENDLLKTLAAIRARRSFDPEHYIRAKCELLNAYMRRCGLQSCVVALSGGIDSAVTLGLVTAAKNIECSPIERIIAVLLPVFDSPGATNQREAFDRGKEVAEKFGVTPITVDLSEIHARLKQVIDISLKISGQPWASGQLVSYLRTPALYYITSLMTEQNLPAVLCGTTNRDEGAYLGFFGKASDGMVDVQLISDIHKSEVRKLAGKLGVPASTMQAAPTGDMFDGRVDEEVFGTPYDFVELYLSYLSLPTKRKKTTFVSSWRNTAKEQFHLYANRLERLHAYNAHKYVGDTPALHFDVYERGVPGGWNTTKPLYERKNPV